jgi:hypothetical protein
VKEEEINWCLWWERISADVGFTQWQQLTAKSLMFLSFGCEETRYTIRKKNQILGSINTSIKHYETRSSFNGILIQFVWDEFLL